MRCTACGLHIRGKISKQLGSFCFWSCQNAFTVLAARLTLAAWTASAAWVVSMAFNSLLPLRAYSWHLCLLACCQKHAKACCWGGLLVYKTRRLANGCAVVYMGKPPRGDIWTLAACLAHVTELFSGLRVFQGGRFIYECAVHRACDEMLQPLQAACGAATGACM